MLKRSLLFNLLLALLVVIGLLFAFFSSLNYLTNHGKQTIIPKVEGKNMEEAVTILKKQGFKIHVDSTFQSYSKPLEVLYQEPESGANVKVGRTVFITVNRKTPPSIPMPNLVNTSFRNALLTMQSYRLVMGDTTYKPDVAAGAVLEQWINGRKVMPGTMVPIGSKIDLVIGEGLSDMQDVPNIIGMSWTEAKALLDSKLLTINPIWEGEITDSAHAVVYNQQPEAINELDFQNSILSGDIIDVRIMQSPSQELLLKNQPGSKKLLGTQEQQLDSNGDVIAPAPEVIETPIGSVNRDSIKKPRIVPGTHVPSSVPKATIEKNNNKIINEKVHSANTNTPKSDVIKKVHKQKIPSTIKSTTAPTNHSSPKKETKDAPVKHSGDDISNGFD